MSIMKYKDPSTGEVKKVFAPTLNAYTKTESDTLLAGKANSSSVYTKTESDTLLSKKMANDLGQSGADLLKWASAQTSGGSFVINPTVTTTGVPVVTWYAGLLEVNSAGRKMTITKGAGGAPITYVNVTAAGVWQGWLQVVDTSMLCNPNLLDNWYFGNPVNQRGQTSYTTNIGASIYSIDRWKIWGQYTAKDTLSINDGYISFNSNGHAYGGITTTIESARLRGETLILSIFGRGRTTGRSMWLAVDSYDASDAQTRICDTYLNFDTIFSIIQKNGLTVPSDSVTLRIQMLCSNDEGGIYDFKAIKLELGDHQTLAHQDANGNWVLNEIPNYAQELAKCKRYYQVLTNFSTYAINQWGNSFEFLVLLPVEMRTAPSATFPSDLAYTIRELGNTNLTPSNLYLLGDSYASSKSVYIVVKGSEFSLGKAYSITVDIPLSADL